MELRYLGFDQKLNTRVYRFERVAKGEPVARFVVTADMALFLAHRIAIQEGPSLCAQKLAADLAIPRQTDLILTNEDFLAHVSARAAAEAHKAESRRNASRHAAQHNPLHIPEP